MDIGKAFTFPFDDPEWATKLLLPALIGLIPILGQIFLIGWALDIAQRVIRRDPTPLPQLDFGRQLEFGWRGFVINLVYALPIFVLLVPIIFIAASQGNQENLTFGSLIMILFLTLLMVLYSLFLYLVLPAAYARAVVEDRLGAGLNFSEVFGLIRAAPVPYLLTMVVVLLAGAIIAPIGSILCGVGAVLTFTYTMAISGHLYGQAYLEATQNR